MLDCTARSSPQTTDLEIVMPGIGECDAMQGCVVAGLLGRQLFASVGGSGGGGGI